MTPDANQVEKAVAALGDAMSTLAPSEKQTLANLRRQVEDAAGNSPDYDKRLEFCYAILFTPEVTNERVKTAAKMYVDAHGGL